MPNVVINKLYYCLAQSVFSLYFKGIPKELRFGLYFAINTTKIKIGFFLSGFLAAGLHMQNV